jgi:hypothetical protein
VSRCSWSGSAVSGTGSGELVNLGLTNRGCGTAAESHSGQDERGFGMSQAVPTLEAVSVTVELPDEALRKLTAEAERRGVSIDVIVAEFAAALPGEPAAPKRRLAFMGMGASSSGRGARDADEMLVEGFGRD